MKHSLLQHLLLALCFLYFPLFTLHAQEAKVPNLVINEVQVANLDQYLDNSFCYGGWIELYNPTSERIPLRGLILTDGQNSFLLKALALWGYVPAEGYKVLWFGHSETEGTYGSGSKRQVPFKLETEGGTISLLTNDSLLICAASYPPAIARCSWARTTDGNESWAYTGNPSPGASNAESQFAEFRLEEPQVDTDSRVFAEPFTVNVTIPAGYTLRYTTDGSAPTASYGLTSTTGRFDISETTILRFCYLCDGFLPSPVVTRSYIYRNHDYYLPILSVVSSPKHFFDNKVGVFVRGTNGVSGNGQSSACNWNMDWERPVNMEYLIPLPTGNGDYQMVLNQEMDLEICGGWTRAYGGATVDGKTWEARSSFRLKTDKRYEGVSEIPYPVFPSKPYNKYRSWQVRNGGNDTFVRTKDPAIQMMVLKSSFYVDCQDYQPAHVFINGMYYGMLNIRESNNKHYAYSNYGIDFDDMDQFDLSNAKYNQKVGDDEAWLQLQSLARKLGLEGSTDVYEQIKGLLDIDEYINYMALECYMGPTDWITNTNNIKGFRSRDDGKFHFVLFDCDSAFGTTNMLVDVLGTSAGANVDDLFRNLMKYEPFRRQFMDAYCIVNGSVFEPVRCNEIMREIATNVNQALSFEGRSAGMGLANAIAAGHNGPRMTTLRNYYEADYEISLGISSNISGARIAVNGQELPTGKFDGLLYSYDGNPVRLTAKAPAGYMFQEWQTEGTADSTRTIVTEGATWMYYDRGSMDGRDWTSPDFDASAHRWQSGTAPFGFGRDGYYMQTASATKLNEGTSTRRPTYYFRKTFRLDVPLDDQDIVTFNYQVDDGMMLYVNGHEVGGYYIQSDAPFSEYTLDGHFESAEPHFGSFTIPHEYLVSPGVNQLAVQVKNCSATSTDIWFEGSLTLTGKDRQTLSMSDDIDLTELFADKAETKLKAVFIPNREIVNSSIYAPLGISINEVNAAGDICISPDYRKRSDWIELYNPSDQDVSLTGCFLSDDATNPRKYQLPQGIVPARGTRLVWCDGRSTTPSDGEDEASTMLHAPFKLENADGAIVSIEASDGSWSDVIEYRQMNKWQTFGRYPDGSRTVCLMSRPTIDASNILVPTDFNLLDAFHLWNDPDGIDELQADGDMAEWEWRDDKAADGKVLSVKYYDLNGREIVKPSNRSGICIRKVTFTDGRVLTTKLFR